MDARNAIEKGQRLRTASIVRVHQGTFSEDGMIGKQRNDKEPTHIELDGRNEHGACVGVMFITTEAALALATQIRFILTNQP